MLNLAKKGKYLRHISVAHVSEKKKNNNKKR